MAKLSHIKQYGHRLVGKSETLFEDGKEYWLWICRRCDRVAEKQRFYRLGKIKLASEVFQDMMTQEETTFAMGFICQEVAPRLWLGVGLRLNEVLQILLELYERP